MAPTSTAASPSSVAVLEVFAGRILKLVSGGVMIALGLLLLLLLPAWLRFT